MANDGEAHTIAVVVDAGPGLVSFLADGMLCDGGGIATSGFTWTDPASGQVRICRTRLWNEMIWFLSEHS